MLRLEQVDAYYGKAKALSGVSVELKQGEILALLGRNGAGKTTILRTMMGLLPCGRGRRFLAGEDVTNLVPYQLSRMGIAYVPEDRQIFAGLTVAENLATAGIAHRAGYWTVQRVCELFPRLGERFGSKGISLSGGEQQMLSIARAVLTNPKVLMLDEPSEGLAPLIVRVVRDAIVAVNKQGMSVVLVEQKVAIPLAVSHQICVVDHGSLAWSGTTSQFRADRSRIEQLMTV